MKNVLEALSKFRKILMENCKNLNKGKSPVFIFISMMCGIILATVSAFLTAKTMLWWIGVAAGALVIIVNALQLIYKKHI